MAYGIIHTGYTNNARFYLEWSTGGQDIANNRTLIHWTAGIQAYPGRSSYWYSNAVKIYSVYIDGQGNLASGTWSNIILNNGQTVPLRSGSIWVGHNGDGTKGFGASFHGYLYSYADHHASGNWGIETIPRNSQVTFGKGDYVLGEGIGIHTNRKSGSFTHQITLRHGHSGGTFLKQFNDVHDYVAWHPNSAEITQMQNLIPNSNTFTLNVWQHNWQVGQASQANATLWLENANPQFTDFTYRDSNAASVAVTGDDQIFISGKSTLEAKISSANKMVAIKGASPVRYNISFDGQGRQEPYQASGDVIATFEPEWPGQRSIWATAIDSRGNNTSIQKNVSVYDYVAPSIITTLKRENNFGNNTTVTIRGTWTPLMIDGVVKNQLKTGTLKYRYAEDGQPFGGTWTSRTFTVTGSEWTMTTPFVVSLDNTKKYNFEFQIEDKFEIVTSTNSVDVGLPIMFVGENNGLAQVGIGKMPTQGSLDVTGDIYSNNNKVQTAVEAAATYVQCYIDGNDTNQGWTGYRRFNAVTAVGITATNNTRFTIVTKGLYWIHFNQLVNTGPTAINYYIRVNGVDKSRGWHNSIQIDYSAGWNGILNPGDYVQLWTDQAPANSWSDTHSSFVITKIAHVP